MSVAQRIKAGDKRHNLTVVEVLPDRHAIVRCDCGMVKEIDTRNFGKTKSCGHIEGKPPVLDISGRTFGRLTVTTQHKSGLHYKTLWLCNCACGNTCWVGVSQLTTGKTNSCGCYRKEVITKHGMYNSRVYSIWEHMISRCSNANNKFYDNYGGRGVKVCSEWLEFRVFYEDMGDPPSDKHSIDRINNNGNYEPNNCRWATYSVQLRNTRKQERRLVGITELSSGKWLVRIGVDAKRVRVGIYTNIDDAITARKEAEIKYWPEKSASVVGSLYEHNNERKIDVY